MSFVRRVTPVSIVAGAYDTSQTIRVGNGKHIIDRATVETNGPDLTHAIVSYVYEEGDSTARESHLGNGFCALRYPLVIKGPFEIEGPGYIQLMFWIPVVGAAAELMVVFRRGLH